jgi:hypothetical protein
MAEIPSEWKKHLFESNPMRCMWVEGLFSYLGFACVLIGIISDTINRVLGLEPTNWFLFAIGCFILAGFAWFRGYFSALHHSGDAKR